MLLVLVIKMGLLAYAYCVIGPNNVTCCWESYNLPELNHGYQVVSPDYFNQVTVGKFRFESLVDVIVRG